MAIILKKHSAKDVILFHAKRKLTAEEEAKGIVLNEHGNVPTGNEFIDQFAPLIRTLGWATMNTYAKVAGIEPRTLSILVKTFSEDTFSEWIDHYMLLGACELLAKTNKSINEVSEQLGFPKPPVFCKFCKTRTGYMPTDIRYYLRNGKISSLTIRKKKRK